MTCLCISTVSLYSCIPNLLQYPLHSALHDRTASFSDSVHWLRRVDGRDDRLGLSLLDGKLLIHSRRSLEQSRGDSIATGLCARLEGFTSAVWSASASRIVISATRQYSPTLETYQIALTGVTYTLIMATEGAYHAVSSSCSRLILLKVELIVN